MEIGRIAQWIQILGPIGMLLGVVLVIAQLRQTQNLVRLELYTEIDLNRQQLESSVLGEEFSVTLGKVRSSPESLTDAELLQFDAYADSLIRQFDLYRVLYEQDVFTIDWRFYINSQVCHYFDHAVGRAYLEWKVNGPGTGPGAVERELSERVQQCNNEDQPNYLEFIRNRVNQGANNH